MDFKQFDTRLTKIEDKLNNFDISNGQGAIRSKKSKSASFGIFKKVGTSVETVKGLEEAVWMMI